MIYNIGLIPSNETPNILDDDHTQPTNKSHRLNVTISSFLKNKGCTTINLSGLDIDDDDCGYLFGCLKKHNRKKIVVIDLSDNIIGDDGMQFIVNWLKDNNTINYINLANNRLGDRGLEIFSQALPHKSLKVVDIRANHSMSVEGFTPVLIKSGLLSRVDIEKEINKN